MPMPNSFDKLLALNSQYGPLVRLVCNAETAASPAANTTSGLISIHRCKTPFVVPTFDGPTEAFLTYCEMMYGGNRSLPLMAIEYNLGNINMSTGTFTSGVSMPTKTIEGESIQTASILTLATVTSAVTATTPGLTITYTDQDGNTGQTCSMTLPTSPVLNTAYLMTPHLANGDTGVRAVTNCTKSAGSAGTITFYGLLPLALGNCSQSLLAGTLNPLADNLPNFPIEEGDTLSWWIFNSQAAQDFFCAFALEAGME